jgi:hypothetical protein
LLAERNPEFPGQWHVVCAECEEYHRQAIARPLAVAFAQQHLATDHGITVQVGGA